MKKLEAMGIKYAATYTKAGERAEVIAAYTTDRLVIKPDPNTPHTVAGDYRSAVYGEVQVKSPRATVVEGWNIHAHIEADAAEVYAYVVKSEEWVILFTPAEWERFLNAWAFQTYHSSDGRPKMRLKPESEAMRLWLDRELNGGSYDRPYYWARG